MASKEITMFLYFDYRFILVAPVYRKIPTLQEFANLMKNEVMKKNGKHTFFKHLKQTLN